MALGRCATTMTMAPRARSPRMARVSDSSPSASRLELGSSEHDQERIAIKRARKRDALRLASGQGAAVFADIGFLAVRQIDDEVVNAGRLRGREHSLGMGRPLEARNILRHVAGEQFDVLRQVADMPAERLQ